VKRARAERLGERSLEARQPGRRPAREVLELRQLVLEAGVAIAAPIPLIIALSVLILVPLR